MSLAHLNGAHPGDSVQAEVAIPDPHFVPGNTVFGNRYPRAFKLKVLQETDACTKSGELGKYLRQHGLTHTTLTCFRKQRASGALGEPKTSRSTTPPASRKRAAAENAEGKDQAKKLMELERENRKLRRQLEQAEVIIDIQKKVARLLEIPLDEPPTGRRNRLTNDKNG